jgi:predicted nucleic acid-binding protein
LEKAKIYLDNCCLNRPFDDLADDKVRHESEAVLTIIDNCENGIWDIFESDVLDDEIDRIKNPIKKQKVSELYSSASIYVEINSEIINRAKEFGKHNIKPFDALHLASAEYADADILLSTDKKFINRAQETDSKVRVANPAIWLTEVLYND